MGTQPGKIAEHLREITRLVAGNLMWEAYQDKMKDPQCPLRMVPESYIFPQGKPAQMPDLYATYLQLKQWNKLWCEGALGDQPHLLQLALDACAAGESQFAHTDYPQLKKIEEINGPQQAATGLSAYLSS